MLSFSFGREGSPRPPEHNGVRPHYACGAPSNRIEFNPNGSLEAVEGITSPCGRVLGKMGHTERAGANVAKNIPGNKHQPLFQGGVDYFA